MVKVFYVSSDNANLWDTPSSNIWNINLYMSLKKMCEVVLPGFNVTDQFNECFGIKGSRTQAEARKYYSNRLLEDVKIEEKKGHIDLFFSYYYSNCVLPEVIDQIRGLGIKTVNFYCNNVHQFDLVSEIAPHYDYCMVPEQEALYKYRDIGAKPVHIQMAANPDVYKPYPLAREYDVTFVGQNYLDRQEYMAYLYRNGIDARVWGPNWGNAVKPRNLPGRLLQRFGLYRPALPADRLGPVLSDDELIKMYSRSKISLNFSEVLVQDEKYSKGAIKRHIRLRDFEAPMSGAFYMTGYQDELKDYYVIDREIVCYDTKKELLEKIRYYLKNPEEAEAIRKAGLARALKDHTWENRFRQLFDIIGLKQ